MGTSGSGGEDFLKFYHFTIYGHGGQLGDVTWAKFINFLSCLDAAFEIKMKLAQ